MRKIGLRNFKTALAVLITLMISLVLNMISPDLANTWYSPFFASIAAVYSMQRETNQTYKQARIRVFGSVIGGLFGMILMLIYEALLMEMIVNQYGDVMNLLVLYIITALMMMVLIYVLVRYKINDLVFVAALTYLSVMVSIRSNLPVVSFSINRILSTTVGVLVTLMIQQVKWHWRRNKNVLFVSAIDQCLLDQNTKLTPFTIYQLSQLLNDGIHFTISTTRTPASLVKIFKDVPMNRDLMIMNGAVIYNIKDEKYLDIKYIDKMVQINIDQYFRLKQRNVFTYTIIDQALSIYHSGFENEAEEKFYFDRKNDYFRNHVKGRINETDHALFYILIDQLDVVESYRNDLMDLYGDDIHCQIYPYPFFAGYHYLKIYAAKSSKLEALKSLIHREKCQYVIGFVGKELDLELINQSDLSVCLANAEECVKEQVDIVLEGSNPDELIKLMKKIYYSTNFLRFIEYLKTKKR